MGLLINETSGRMKASKAQQIRGGSYEAEFSRGGANGHGFDAPCRIERLANPAGLRIVSGAAKGSNREEPEFSIRSQKYRCRASFPRAHRSLRQPAQPDQAGLLRLDLLYARHGRPDRYHGARLGPRPGEAG